MPLPKRTVRDYVCYVPIGTYSLSVLLSLFLRHSNYICILGKHRQTLLADIKNLLSALLLVSCHREKEKAVTAFKAACLCEELKQQEE